MVGEINVFQLLTNVRISDPVEMTGLRIFLFAIAAFKKINIDSY